MWTENGFKMSIRRCVDFNIKTGSPSSKISWQNPRNIDKNIGMLKKINLTQEFLKVAKFGLNVA
jgi:hypothetical protein